MRSRENGYSFFNSNDLFNLFLTYFIMILMVYSLLVEMFPATLIELLTFGFFLLTLLFEYIS